MTENFINATKKRKKRNSKKKTQNEMVEINPNIHINVKGFNLPIKNSIYISKSNTCPF